jgi:hypothetical protein
VGIDEDFTPPPIKIPSYEESPETLSEYEEIYERIKSDWGDGSLALRLFEQLLNVAKFEKSHFIALDKFISDQEGIEAIKKIEDVIIYFSGSRSGLLDIGFQLEEDSEPIPLSVRSVYEAIKNGYLLHPSTGEEIENFRSTVLMVFYATEKLNKLLRAHGSIQ